MLPLATIHLYPTACRSATSPSTRWSTYKDRSQLVYSNDKTLSQWREIYGEVSNIELYVQDPLPRFNQHLALAKKLGAEYMITHFKFDFASTGLDPSNLVYSNPTFRIIKLK